MKERSRTRVRGSRRGTSLIEISMATAILAAALVPIGWYFVSTAQQQADLQAESIAAAYAGKVMNELLTERRWDELDGPLAGSEEIDGTTVEWSAAVANGPDPDFTFTNTSGATETLGIEVLDAKNDDNQGWVKDMVVTFRWQGPQHTEMGNAVNRREQILVTRRTRL